MAKDEKSKAKTKRPTAQKRDIQNEKRRLANRSKKACVLTAIRSFAKGLSQDKLSSVYSLVDKGVKTGLIKLNKASRIKSRLSQRVQKAS